MSKCIPYKGLSGKPARDELDRSTKGRAKKKA